MTADYRHSAACLPPPSAGEGRGGGKSRRTNRPSDSPTSESPHSKPAVRNRPWAATSPVIFGKNMTDAECRLWYHLRGRQFDGKKFREQSPIGAFVVDFVCFESSLIVELDGGQHAAEVDYDEDRTAWLNSRGFRVLRFWNSQVFEELDVVLESIWNVLQDTDRPRLSAEAGRDPD